MSSTALDRNLAESSTSVRFERWPVLAVAAAVLLLHLLTNGRYGFHRDEFQFLSDGKHIDWGFVAYPPMTAFIERISMSVFGLSIVGLRLCSVLAQVTALILTAMMAKELGGARLSQVTAALTVALSPLPMFEATEFQYSSFDFLWWVLIAYCVVRLLKSDDPRWWIGIGAAIGLGLLTKYSIVFYIAGIIAGMVLTRSRRHVASPWFWGGVALALAIFLPNLLWLIRNDFISYHFLQGIHKRDVAIGRASGFLKDQFLICINVAAAPLCLAGLVTLFRSSRYRMLAWMYVVPVVIFWLAKGRGYYVAAAYPMLIAMGVAAREPWLDRQRAWVRRSIHGVYFTALAAVGAYVCAVILPLATSGPLRDFALSKNSDLREEIGWPELVKTVAGIRDSLTPDQQAHLGITTGNYGEYGSIDVLGAAYGLPTPIGTTNSEWLRGYPATPPTTIIALGITREEAESLFTGCRVAGHNDSLGVNNEESEDHGDIFLCGPARRPWAEIWKEHKNFG